MRWHVPSMRQIGFSYPEVTYSQDILNIGEHAMSFLNCSNASFIALVPASLRQRRYVLQPRVVAQRLPWGNGSTERVNPERVVFLAAGGAATPLGLKALRVSTIPG